MNDKILKRPLLTISISLLLSLAISGYVGVEFSLCLTLYPIISALSVICVVLSLYIKSYKIGFIKLSLIFLGMLLALTSLAVLSLIGKANSEKALGEHSITAYASDIVYNSDNGSAAFMNITSIDNIKCNIHSYFVFEEQLPDNKFTEFTFTAKISPIADFCDSYNTEKSFAAKSVSLGGSAIGTVSVSGDAHGIIPFFGKLNGYICSYISKNLSDSSAGLLNALLFGDTSLLSETVKRDFKTLGITHMLVVSGMNIALIAGELETLLLFLRRKRSVRLVLTTVVCLFYMALCGFKITVIRAALMQIFCRVSLLVKKDNDSNTALFFSAALICLINPGAVFDVGFALSFFATLGIINRTGGKYLSLVPLKSDESSENAAVISDNKDKEKPDGEFDFIISKSEYAEYNAAKESETAEESAIKPSKHNYKRTKFSIWLENIASSFGVSLFACIFTFPICALTFGEVSLIGPLCTLIFAVFLDILLFITPIFLLFSPIPFIGKATVFITEFLCGTVIFLTSNAVYLKDFLVYIDKTAVKILIIPILAFIVFVLTAKQRFKAIKYLSSLGVWLIICAVTLITPDKNGAFFFSDNQNEAIFIKSGGKSAVIDISSGSKSFAFECRNESAANLLDTNVDIVVLTHLHNRHISEIYSFCTSGYLEKLIIPLPFGDEEKSIAEALKALSERYNFTLTIYRGGYDGAIELANGVSFCGERLGIARSSHDVVSFSVDVENTKITYLSSSAFEACSDFIPLLTLSDSAIIGSHAPLAKQSFSYLLINRETQVIYASAKVKELSLINSDNETVLKDKDVNEIIIKTDKP